MSVLNNNKMMLDRPMWEQLSFLPTTAGVGGSSMTDDGVRYIYWLNVTSTTAATFWRYDTWYDTWQQLTTPPTTTIAFGAIEYTDQIGGSFSGRTYGSVYSFQCNGTVAAFYLYDIATNSWSTKSIATIPATFGGDVSLCLPEPSNNGYISGYHSGVLRSVTLASAITAGATTATVSATLEAMPAGTRLRFGTVSITLSADATKGSTTINVSAIPVALSVGTQLILPSGDIITVSVVATASATSISVYPIQRAIANATVITVEQFVVLTAAAASGATSLTISAALYGIANGSSALYYGNMYLIGNGATQMYRYNISTDTWSTTSANTSNPALAAITAAVGTGCSIRWLPLYAADRLYIIRGNGSATTYIYNLVSNTITIEMFYQTTETFSTGTSVATRSVNGRQSSVIIGINNSGRFFERRPDLNTLEPKATQWLYPYGPTVVGDRACCITSPDGIEFLYTLVHSTQALVRCAMIDS